MVCLNDYIAVFIFDGIYGVSSLDSVFKRFHNALSIGKCHGIDSGDGITSDAAVFLTNDEFLANVNHTSGKVTGVRGTKCGIGKTFTGTVCGNEVFQNVQTFTEVGFDRQLDGTSGRICHESTHRCKLFHLLLGTTGTGVSHHLDVVVSGQTVHHFLGQALIGVIPNLDNALITLVFGTKSTMIVSGDSVHLLLSLSQ